MDRSALSPASEPAALAGGAGRPGPLAAVLLVLLAGYRRFVSPLLGPRCRFAPSCSAYAAEAVRIHGAFKGSYLAARRLLRCHPFNPGGYDPVPASTKRRVTARPSRPTGARPC